MNAQARECGGCRQHLPLTAFSINIARADGLEKRCRACRSAANRARYAANPEKGRIKRAEWIACNPEKARTSGQKYRDAHRAARAARERARYYEDPERRKACNQERHAQYPQRRREDNLLKKYGMTLADFDAKMAAQGGCCAICERDLAGLPTKKTHVDHCHESGVVRAILCSWCNVAIGMLQDDPDVLRKAAEYVRLWSIFK
jgi:phage-related minor tail protein